MSGQGYGLQQAMGQVGGAAWDVIRSRYWDPFLDVAGRQMPKDLRTFWNMCMYYSLTHPIISPLIQKKSTYVVTKPIYQTDNSSTREQYTKLFEGVLNIRSFLAQHNMDYNTYGTAYASPVFPFRKLLRCKNCGHQAPADQLRYVMESLRFMLDKCPKCYTRCEAEPTDVYYRSAAKIRMIRWNPQFIEVEENPATGQCTYYLRPPVVLENALRVSKRSIISQTPQILIDTIREKKLLKFNPDFLFTSKRPGPSNQTYRGYGVPLLMPAMKDAFLMQIARKAQESIMFEHIVPIRFAFPQDPQMARMVSMSDLQQNIAEQLREWRRDQNRILVFPTPIAVEELGGKGRALLLNPEIRQMAEMICAACGLPMEFLFGGVSYSGSNVSLRIIENDFLFNFADNEELLQYTADRVAWFMGWPQITVKQKPFKMADDLQRAAFDASLAAQMKLSNATLLESRDYSPEHEIEAIDKEIPIYGELVQKQQMLSAKAAGAASLISTQYQIQAARLQQGAMVPAPGGDVGGEPQEAAVGPEEAMQSMQSVLFPGIMGMVPNQYADYMHRRLQGLNPEQQRVVLSQLKEKMPGVAATVAERMSGQGLSESDLKPLPDKLPPRRPGGII